jgi:FeS assembly SUF system regulator
MLSLTKKTDYALVALTCLAQRAKEGKPPVSARKLADEHGLPFALVANILKELHQAKIVNSSRGQQGGYSLALDASQISLSEVIVAMEGPIRVAECGDDLPVLGQGCQIACKCPIREPIRRLNQRIQGFFRSVTLADLLDNKIDSLVDVSASAKRKPAFEAVTPVVATQVKTEPTSSEDEHEMPGWLKPVSEIATV